MTNIHDTAIISPNTKIGENVSIGPYCNIDGDVTIKAVSYTHLTLPTILLV